METRGKREAMAIIRLFVPLFRFCMVSMELLILCEFGSGRGAIAYCTVRINWLSEANVRSITRITPSRPHCTFHDCDGHCGSIILFALFAGKPTSQITKAALGMATLPKQ